MLAAQQDVSYVITRGPKIMLEHLVKFALSNCVILALQVFWLNTCSIIFQPGSTATLTKCDITTMNWHIQDVSQHRKL